MIVRGASRFRPAKSYDPANLHLAGLQTTQSGGSGLLQDYAYQWDRVGNLKERKDRLPATDVVETFGYDALNRLATVTHLAGSTTQTMNLTYDPDGNIRTKTGTDNNVGTYNYATTGTGAGPHAVSNITGGSGGAAGTFHYDSAGNLDCRMGWNGTGCAASSGITWYSFNLPQRINYTGGSYADFAYGPSRERVRQTVVTTTPAVNKTVYYVGPHFEVEVENNVAVRYRSNVFFGDRLVYSQIDKVSDPEDLQQYYVHQDYQGSVDRVSWAGGSTFAGVIQYSFDAFGKRRETTWLNDADNSTFGDNHWLERGYTGHEMLDNVRMIHMNGRVQDPTWGRMLSPDPVVGDLTLPQSLNAYSYVGNNPASWIDLTGFIPEQIVTGSRIYPQCQFICTDGAISLFLYSFEQITENLRAYVSPILGQSGGGKAGGRQGAGDGQKDPPQSQKCTAPPVDRSKEASVGGVPHFAVATYIGFGLSDQELNSAFDKWRNGSSWAPGGSPNTPDNTAYQLDGLGGEYFNWVYVTTDAKNRTFTNWTLPGHIFEGRVENSIQTAGGFSFMVSMGTGSDQKIALNALAGPALFKELQESVLTGSAPPSIGNQCGRGGNL